MVMSSPDMTGLSPLLNELRIGVIRYPDIRSAESSYTSEVLKIKRLSIV